MLVAVLFDIGNSGQILSYKLPQDTCSCAVKNAYTGHADEYGIIYEIGHGIDGFIASHAAHIKVLPEVQLAVIYHVAGIV